MTTSPHFRAALVTVTALPAAAALYYAAAPEACVLGRAPALYRWSCLFPVLLMVMGPIVALILALARRFGPQAWSDRRGGWLLTILALGLLTQALFTLGYMLMLNRADYGPFLAQSLVTPQPFLAGALAAAVYLASLHWARRTRA